MYTLLSWFMRVDVHNQIQFNFCTIGGLLFGLISGFIMGIILR